MIRCNNCGKLFANDDDIPLLVEWENGEVKLLEVGKFTKPGGETFRGCPHCMTDEYLMDMEVSEKCE